MAHPVAHKLTLQKFSMFAIPINFAAFSLKTQFYFSDSYAQTAQRIFKNAHSLVTFHFKLEMQRAHV